MGDNLSFRHQEVCAYVHAQSWPSAQPYARFQELAWVACCHGLTIPPSPTHAWYFCARQTAGQPLPPYSCDGFSQAITGTVFAHGVCRPASIPLPCGRFNLRDQFPNLRVWLSGDPGGIQRRYLMCGPANTAPAQAHGMREDSIRDAQMPRAARKAGCRFHGRKPRDGVGHFRFSLSDSVPLRTHPSWAHWAMKAHCALRTTLHFLRFSGLPGRSQPRHNGGNPALPLRNAAKYKAISGSEQGEKIPSNFFVASGVYGWSRRCVPGQSPSWQIPANTTHRTSSGGAASAPGMLSPSFHAGFAFSACVPRAERCWEYSGCLR